MERHLPHDADCRGLGGLPAPGATLRRRKRPPLVGEFQLLKVLRVGRLDFGGIGRAGRMLEKQGDVLVHGLVDLLEQSMVSLG
jgi:hypothetical protein